MSYTSNAINTGWHAGDLPSAAFAGVRTRRVMAVALDFAIVATLVFGLSLFLAVATLGLSLLLLPALFLPAALLYNGMTISGPGMGTWGMRLMDLEIGLADGRRAPFVNAAAHAVLFYLSLSFPPLLLASFLSRDKRCLHDLLADVIVTRRMA